MEQQESKNNVGSIPMQETTHYHRQLEAKYKDINQEEINVSPDAMKLIAFNGYYALNDKGAFFAIDTNLTFTNGSSTPIYDVALLISLDGTTSSRFDFTGTFDGTNLVQLRPGDVEGLSIELTLTRTDGSDGTTAKCSGYIALPAKPSVQVSGSTYNNPIPVSLFTGEYYETEPLYLSPSNKTNASVKVMQIKDHQVSYDFGTNDGKLKTVPTYSYNMNMYYFSFSQGTGTDTQSVSLIMGTAAAGGFACNNMIVDKASKAITSRSLQTIPFPEQQKFEPSDVILSDELAAFSGYYQISSVAPGAFVSIQAEYAVMDGLLKLYMVQISISLDGKTSNGYYFDSKTMTFQNNTLTMPDQKIAITFNREYIAAQKSLVTITASIKEHQNITGYTLFNPVPLLGFGGVPMTSPKKDTQKNSLTVVSNSEVILNGIPLQNFIYVPLMYILASPWNAPTTEMSFGTDGLGGNTCILIEKSGTTVVYAIPSEVPDNVNN